MFLKEGGDESIALLCKDAKKSIDFNISECVIKILSNLHLSLTIIESNAIDCDNPDAASMKLEKTGFLYQGLRCFKYWDGSGAQNFDNFFERLQASTVLLSKKCKKGKPLRDMLEELLQMNKPLPNVIKTKVQRLVSIADLVTRDESNSNEAVKPMVSVCRNCRTRESELGEEKKLRFCSKCKTTGYCCRECQTADWTSHKKLCKEISESKERQFSNREIRAHQRMLSGFFQNNHISILRQVCAFCQERKVTKRDILLVVDFFGDAPALRGEFKIALAKRYFEGSRPDEPVWFPENLWKGVKDQYQRMTTGQLLTVCHYPDGSSGVSNVSLKSPSSGLPIMSDEERRVLRESLEKCFIGL